MNKLREKFEQMDEKQIDTNKEWSNERTITTVTNKRKEVVKNHNRLHPEDIEYSERKIEIG